MELEVELSSGAGVAIAARRLHKLPMEVHSEAEQFREPSELLQLPT